MGSALTLVAIAGHNYLAALAGICLLAYGIRLER